LAKVNDLRVWSNPDYTRVVVDVDQEVTYAYRLLKKDPSIGKPQRLYIDVSPARMGDNVKPAVPIGDDLLSHARAAQYLPDTVRVVLDIKSIDNFKIFSLKNPYRVVLDVNGISNNGSRKIASRKERTEPGASIPKGSLAKQLALGVRRVVIDPGHGGKDPGALGYYKSIREKDVTLEVSRRLAAKVREKLGIEAILTRDRDVFLALEERTAIANTKNGDIFVSVHANANRNKRTRGIETYFLNLATDNDAIMVAARENATSAKNISDLEAILNDLMKNAKINESSRLATHVQRAMTKNLRKRFKDVRDHGVKQAPFYVLLGAEMPCILTEIAFISNPTECKRLNTAGYQDALADAIVAGIRNYVEEITPTAFQRTEQDLQALR
jgi:N-acetylmuramoyl-L-alanine amidase